MSRKQPRALTDAELRVMKVLWEIGTAGVGDIADALAAPRLAYTTVQTMLKVLEEKGHVAHTQSGRAFLYRARTSREAATSNALGRLLQQFFQNEPGALALRLLRDEQIDERELRRLEKLIEERVNDDES